MNTQTRVWAVVPAAGVGRRMGADRPKQYLELAGRTVIEHTLARLARHPAIAGVVVAVSADDPLWPAVAARLGPSVRVVAGGAERCHSVLNGLRLLREVGAPGDWVLVHDAARPCLRSADIDRLLTLAGAHPVGGLLGLPVSDTVKRADSTGAVLETVERRGLWRALTPQMFRLETLADALEDALARALLVTDEASAIEAAGLRPLMIEGHPDNIKITLPGDLALAELFLTAQAGEG